MGCAARRAAAPRRSGWPAVRHLDGEARWPAAAVFVPAAAAMAAGAGLVPAAAWLALVPGFAAAWWLATGAAAAIAFRVTLAPAGTRALPPATRALLAAARPTARRRHARARWRSEPGWRAIARLDGIVSTRRSAARTRLVVAAGCFVTGALAWFAAAPPPTRRAIAYAAFGAGAAALGGWAIARSCADPPQVMRPLPLSTADAWRARGAGLAMVLAAVVLANIALAGSLPPLARDGLALAWLPSGAIVAFLGLHYGLTLAPRATAAENLYYGWLAVAVVASWMVPLLGWTVMFAGIVHSGRRLSRAARQDAA